MKARYVVALAPVAALLAVGVAVGVSEPATPDVTTTGPAVTVEVPVGPSHRHPAPPLAPTPTAAPTPAPDPVPAPARAEPKTARTAKKSTTKPTPVKSTSKPTPTKSTTKTKKSTSTEPAKPKKKSTKKKSAPSGLAGQIIARTNSVRAAQGLDPLKTSGCLSSSAASWAAKLDGNDSFAHASLGSVLGKCGYSYAAENLALTGPNRSAAAIVDMWMNSAGHKKNLLSEKASLIGVAVVYDASRDSLVIVQQFGRS